MRSMVEVIEGSRGARRVPAGRFAVADLIGEPAESLRTRVKQIDGHLFDLRLPGYRNDPSTGASSMGSHRHVAVAVEIEIWSHKDCADESLDRRGFVASVMSDCDDIIQALTWEGALAEDNAGTDTDVVSGMVIDSSVGSELFAWSLVQEDWVNHIVRSRLSGSLVVVVTQNAPA